MIMKPCRGGNPKKKTRQSLKRLTGEQQAGESPECCLDTIILPRFAQTGRVNLMANHLANDKMISVIHHLTEGNSIRATSRLCKVHRDTILKYLVEVGNACNSFMDLSFETLHLEHLEIDEIWTFCGKKQGNLTEKERDIESLGDQYLFIALDEETKLIPAYALGKRTAENAHKLAQKLASQLIRRPGGQNDIDISTDGFNAYPGAIGEAFGETAHHGVLIKNYVNPEVGRYAPPRLMNTDRIGIQGITDLATICTSHVERTNLTIRTFMQRFTRLALGFSKKVENLEAAVQLHLAYYNFCWQPREKGKSGKLRPTPCMMAGLTDHVWTIAELIENAKGLEQDRLAALRYAKLRKKLFGEENGGVTI